MIYCPKHETWFFREECDYDEHCWELENWDSCPILRKEMRLAERKAREYLEAKRKEASER